MADNVNHSTEPTFEERLELLEALTDKMEQGSLPLHELMSAYEEGVKLSAGLRAQLERAKARMTEIKLGQGAFEKPTFIEEPGQGSLLDALETEE